MDGFDINNNSATVKIDPDKMVMGRRAEDLLKEIEAKGWKDATKNDTLRAFIMLSDTVADAGDQLIDVSQHANPLLETLMSGPIAEENIPMYQDALQGLMYSYSRLIATNTPLEASAKDYIYRAGLEKEPINQKENVLTIDPEKEINGMKAASFIEAAKNAGWEAAEEDDAIRSFINLYDPNEQGMVEAANEITEGKFKDHELGQEGFRENLLQTFLMYYLTFPERLDNAIKRAAFDKLKTDVDENTLNDLKAAAEQYRKEQAQPEQEEEKAEEKPAEEEKAEEEKVKEEKAKEEKAEEEKVEEKVEEKQRQEENAVQEEDPDRIPIIDPDRQVGGLNWYQFHQKLSANGWPNAEKDNTVRAMFNLCDGKHPRTEAWARMMIERKDFTAELAKDWEISVRNEVREEFLEPAKKDQPIDFEEEQRGSVLYFQDMLNKAGEGYHYDFNAKVPVPEPPVAEEENLQEEQKAPEKQEEQKAPEQQEQAKEEQKEPEKEERKMPKEQEEQKEPEKKEEQKEPKKQEEQKDPEKQEEQKEPEKKEEQKEPEKRNDIDFEKLYLEAKRTYKMLEEESLWFGRGSEEYKYAKKQMEQDVKLWEDLVKRKKEDPNYQMSDYEIQKANQLLANEDMLIDTYLENKEQEKKDLEAKGKKLSKTSEDRMGAMHRAKATTSRQMRALDNALSERMAEEPAPSVADLQKESASIEKEMAAADKGVWFGSSEYDDARDAYKQLNEDWNHMVDVKFKDKVPNPADIQWMKNSILNAQTKTDAYLLMKGDDMTNATANARKRAMGRGRDNMNKMLRKIAEWEKANEEKEITYDPDKALADTNTRLDNMKKANEGFFIGSSEYRAAMKAVEEQQKFWEKIQAKGKDYQPDSYELNELERLNNKAEKAVDAYMFNRQQEGMNSKREVNRMSAMMGAKNHVVAQKQILNDRRKALSAEAEKLSYKDLGDQAMDAETELDVATQHVHFGSRAFKNGMTKYARSYNKWSILEEKGADYEPGLDEIKKMKEEMQDAQKAIDVYLNGKKDKDLDKNPKTKKRVEAMKQAHRNLELRIRKLEKMEKKLDGTSKEEKKNFDERVKNLKTNAKDKAGYEKHAARASLAATQKLAQISQKSFMTELDKKEARRAMAALVLEERLKDMPDNEKKNLRKSTAYANAVKNLANSKEFKAALPNDKLTPLNCKQFAKNPESVKRVAKDFNDKLIKNQKAKKENQKQQEKKKELENKKELKQAK